MKHQLRQPDQNYICRSFREAFYYDNEELRSLSTYRLVREFFSLSSERYAALVRFRLEQFFCYEQVEFHKKGYSAPLRSFLPMHPLQCFHAVYCRKMSKVYRWIRFYFAGANRVKTGCTISPYARIGKNLWGGFKSVGITADAIIGENAHIEARVSISGHKGKAPVIGDNVVVHIGGSIIGGVTIGNNVTIGSNSLVTRSLPDNVSVVGVPARVIFRKKKPRES